MATGLETRHARSRLDRRRYLEVVTQRKRLVSRRVPADRVPLVRLIVQIDPRGQLRRPVGERQQSTERRRSAMKPRQCRDLQEAHAPLGFGDRLVAEVVVGTFHVCVAADPEVDRTATMFLLKRIQKILGGDRRGSS